MVEQSNIMKCKNCEFWAGVDDSVVAVCYGIKFQPKEYTFTKDSIVIRDFDDAFIVTGYDFGCTMFEEKS